MIDTYSFGSIVIDGEHYSKDIIIFPDGRLQPNWRRKSGHTLCIDDITELVDSEPESIIAGTGSPGLMKPDHDVCEFLQRKGITFTAVPSVEAVKLFNSSHNKKRTGACFHLTC